MSPILEGSKLFVNVCCHWQQVTIVVFIISCQDRQKEEECKNIPFLQDQAAFSKQMPYFFHIFVSFNHAIGIFLKGKKKPQNELYEF